MRLATLHFMGSRLRRSRAMRRYDWLWAKVAPVWQRAFVRLSRRRGVATYINGDVFRLDHTVGSRYGRHAPRVYEPAFYGAFIASVRPGMRVLDVGAHMGIFTLAAASRVAHGRVYAFEPSQAAAALLARNIRLNHWEDRAEVVPAAVGDTDGPVRFYASGLTTAASLGKSNVEYPLNRETLESPVRELMVESVTVDRFCERLALMPDVLKIDAEGAELLVLRGARRVLTSGDPVVLCEVHPLQMRECGSSVEELEALVADMGYTLERLDEPNDAQAFHVKLVRQRP